MSRNGIKTAEEQKALNEYHARTRALDERTARLRALRLAAEQASLEAAPPEKPKKSRAAGKPAAKRRSRQADER